MIKIFHNKFLTISFIIIIFMIMIIMTLIIFDNDKQNNDGLITMAEFRSQIVQYPKSGGYEVNLLEYDPGDIVQVEDIITNITYGSHDITYFAYKSLGNYTFFTWPFVMGDVRENYTIGDKIIFTLKIIYLEKPDRGVGITGEWYSYIKEYAVTRDSVKRAFDNTDIPIDNDYKPYDIRLNLKFKSNYDNLTRFSFTLTIDEKPFYEESILVGGGQECEGDSITTGIDDYAVGEHMIRITVCKEQMFFDEKEIQKEIFLSDPSRIYIIINEDNILLY